METERLIIDSVRETDKTDYFYNISHDKKVLATFMCRYYETEDEFDFPGFLESYRKNNNLFAIRLKETGRLIGILIRFGEKDGSCEIGYGLGSDHWGRGYATEAVRRFIDYLFYEKGFRTVYASFFTGNDASRHVMEKCGMTWDHFSEKELIYQGIERDLTYYSIHKPSDVIRINEERITAEEYIDFLKRTDLGSQYPKERFAERIAKLVKNVSISLTARNEDGTIVGVLFGLTDFCYWLYVTDLGVDRNYERQGVGTRLMKKAHETAGGEKDIAVYLVANEKAVPFYRKLGMESASDVMVYSRIEWTAWTVE